jgi:hypothetical protein
VERRSLLADLAVFVYLLAAAAATFVSFAWATAPFENATENTGYELALIALPATGLATAWAMARALWADDSTRARRWLFVSLASFAGWVMMLNTWFHL